MKQTVRRFLCDATLTVGVVAVMAVVLAAAESCGDYVASLMTMLFESISQ